MLCINAEQSQVKYRPRLSCKPNLLRVCLEALLGDRKDLAAEVDFPRLTPGLTNAEFTALLWETSISASAICAKLPCTMVFKSLEHQRLSYIRDSRFSLRWYTCSALWKMLLEVAFREEGPGSCLAASKGLGSPFTRSREVLKPDKRCRIFDILRIVIDMPSTVVDTVKLL